MTPDAHALIYAHFVNRAVDRGFAVAEAIQAANQAHQVRVEVWLHEEAETSMPPPLASLPGIHFVLYIDGAGPYGPVERESLCAAHTQATMMAAMEEAVARLLAAWSARDANAGQLLSLAPDDAADSDAAIGSGDRQAVWFLDDPPF